MGDSIEIRGRVRKRIQITIKVKIQINLSQNKKGRNKSREPQISGRAFHNDPGGAPPAASVVMGTGKWLLAGSVLAPGRDPSPGLGCTRRSENPCFLK